MSARAEVQEVSYMKASLHATASRFGHWRVIGALAASNITPFSVRRHHVQLVGFFFF